MKIHEQANCLADQIAYMSKACTFRFARILVLTARHSELLRVRCAIIFLFNWLSTSQVNRSSKRTLFAEHNQQIEDFTEVTSDSNAWNVLKPLPFQVSKLKVSNLKVCLISWTARERESFKASWQTLWPVCRTRRSAFSIQRWWSSFDSKPKV